MPENTGSDDLLRSFADLTDLLVAMPDVSTLLERTAVLAAAAVTPGASCGITLSRNGPALTVAASDARGAQIDELQYEVDEGPCLDALRMGAVVDVPRLADEDRWPGYRPRALTAGVRSSHSMPLRIGSQTIGAVNFYADRPHRFGPVQREHAVIYARQIVNLIRVALRCVEQMELIDQLRQALTSRAVIDQAIGVLAARQGVTPDEAFILLRRASQNSNRKLRDVAATTVRSTSLPDSGSPDPGRAGIRV
jgi:GAF domain-containing protein